MRIAAVSVSGVGSGITVALPSPSSFDSTASTASAFHAVMCGKAFVIANGSPPMLTDTTRSAASLWSDRTNSASTTTGQAKTTHAQSDGRSLQHETLRVRGGGRRTARVLPDQPLQIIERAVVHMLQRAVQRLHPAHLAAACTGHPGRRVRERSQRAFNLRPAGQERTAVAGHLGTGANRPRRDESRVHPGGEGLVHSRPIHLHRI